MCSIHHAFLCMPRVPSHLLWFKYKPPSLHRLCITLDETAILSDVRCSRSPPTAQSQFPTTRGALGHRLFMSLFMIAFKAICDDTYPNKSWLIVGQGIFQLREINQMEREMCQYLEMGAQRRAGHSQGVRGQGPQGLCWPRTLPHLHALDHIKTRRHLHQPLPRHHP